MDTRRTVLWIVFSISLFLIYENWQRYNGQPTMFGPAPASQPLTQTQPGVPAAAGSAPHVASNEIPSASTTPASVPNANTASTSAPTPDLPSQGTEPVKGERVEVRTDLFAADINTLGASLDRLELLAYRDSADPKQNFVLFDQTPGYFYVAQSGLVAGRRASRCRPIARRSSSCRTNARWPMDRTRSRWCSRPRAAARSS